MLSLIPEIVYEPPGSSSWKFGVGVNILNVVFCYGFFIYFLLYIVDS